MNFKSLLPVSALGLALLSGCGRATSAPPAQVPSVVATAPVSEEVVDAVDLTGTIAASQSVDLVARVAGFLQSVNFKDGDFVEAGQVLFVIEPSSYEQQLRNAEAVFRLAQQEYDRQVQLEKKGVTPVEDTDKAYSAREQAAAQVELAKLNLSYTKVSAPFSGRMGRRLVDKGNLVGPSSNSRLATIQQLTPVSAYFSINERDAIAIRNAVRQASSGNQPVDVRNTAVYAGLQTEEGFPHKGALDFVDSGLSTATGTLQLRATFSNEDRCFLPGFFVRVRIPLSAPHAALVIPSRAIASDQEGDYVFVVNANNTVVRRAITKGPAGKAGCSIRSGVSAGDRVIVEGMAQTRVGQQVSVVPAAQAR